MIDFGNVRIDSPGQPMISGQTAKLDRCAASGRTLKLLSIVCATQQAKAYRAVLSKGAGSATTTFDVTCPEYGWRLTKDEAGYTSLRSGLAYGMAHMVFISKDPGFMLSISDEELYDRLYPPSQLYDVPLAEEWLTFVKTQLTSHKLLVKCEGYRTNCGVLSAGNDELAKIVSLGLKQGNIKIPKAGVRLGVVG